MSRESQYLMGSRLFFNPSFYKEKGKKKHSKTPNHPNPPYPLKINSKTWTRSKQSETG
jgi:hypothetical protein